ncbi:MAG: hypothetical protein FJ294_02160 [Planctomycetes bacterium]|nr:hypothetical protein [Planctomycetota bacterium]
MSEQRVRVDRLVDLSKVGRGGRPPTPAELREALPNGWKLDDDGIHAVRDLRLFFSQSWVLLLGLVMFGAAGLGLFATTFPRGERALLRVAILVGVMLVIGGVIGPLVTRALNRR